jgi:hypothetical protein
MPCRELRLAGLALALTLAAPAGNTAGQVGNPLDPCAPPMGQHMTDMRVSVARNNYRAQPTAANKAEICQAIAWAVRSYGDAVSLCAPRVAQCNEAYGNICARRQERLAHWRAEQSQECGWR